MKPRSSVMLAVVLFFCGALVAVETALTSATPTFNGWITAQKQTPALWTLDGCAVLILMVAFIFASYQDSQVQLQKELAAQQQAAANESRTEVAKLKQQLDNAQAAMKDSVLRQNEMNAELRSFSQAATAPLNEHLSAVNRQIDTIHLALQYHRAGLQQVNHQLRDVNAKLQHTAIASPAEGAPRQITEIDAVPEPDSDDLDVITLNAATTVIAEPQTIDASTVDEPIADNEFVLEPCVPEAVVQPQDPIYAVPEMPVIEEIPASVASEDQYGLNGASESPYVTNEEIALLTAPIVLDGDFAESAEALDGTSDFHWPEEVNYPAVDQDTLPNEIDAEKANEELPLRVEDSSVSPSVILNSDENHAGNDTPTEIGDAVAVSPEEAAQTAVDDSGKADHKPVISADPREWFRKL